MHDLGFHRLVEGKSQMGYDAMFPDCGVLE